MIWLALDIGTTNTKAALIDGDDGRVLAHASVPYPPEATRTALGGISEQDPRAWFTAATSAAEQLMKESQEVPFEAVALTGQMQNVILVRPNSEVPVRLAILYNDTRAQTQIKSIQQRWSESQLREITGNDQDATSLLAKLAWLQENEPELLQSAAHILFSAADYVAACFTGQYHADTTTTSTTGLLNIHDSEFWREILAPETVAILPNLVPGGGFVGELDDGGGNVRPVHLGPGDAGASTIGVGSGESGVPYAYIGTSGWVGFTGDQLYAPETGVFNLAHPQKGKYFNVAPLLTAGGNLDFAARLFGTTDYDALTAAALATPPGKLLYLPYLNGERSPFRDPNARGAFIGLEPGHTPAHLTRAVLEGVAFAYRHALEALIPTFPQALTVTGGAAASAGWMQLFADVLNLQINVAADAEFTGVRGAVIAAKVARGELTTYAPEGWFKTTATYAPAAGRAHYDDQYARFRAAYPALKDVF